MKIEIFTTLATLFSRSFATDLAALLVAYTDISASEAASRLDLHIKTVQDWLEGIYELGILKRHEVSEGKRPYYRYFLKETSLDIQLDLNQLKHNDRLKGWKIAAVREKKNADAQFVTSGKGNRIASVSIFTGTGRDRKERKLSLTPRQGDFLYHLPFPTAEHQTVQSIMKTAGLGAGHLAEVADILSVLTDLGVVETKL